MKSAQQIERFNAWLSALPIVKANDGPARGTIAGALVVLERLKTDFDLELNAHLAPKGTQVKGTSGAMVKAILSSLGEHRPYLSEGGRTNRGLRQEISALLDVLTEIDLEAEDVKTRKRILEEMQKLLLAQVAAYHNRQRLKMAFDPTMSSESVIGQVLTAASEANKEGFVAQHLVGAKLQLRFQKLKVDNNSVTTADVQLDRAGDFIIGDTVFHVTVAPMPSIIDKCRGNLKRGLRVYLLVPNSVIDAAKQMARELLSRISILPIETFISQNIDEIGEFKGVSRLADIARLMKLYNQRVDEVERDKSLLIELPKNLD